MSEFIQRLQARLKDLKQTAKQASSKGQKEASDPLVQNGSIAAYIPHGALSPANVVKGITYVLMLSSPLILCFWLMKIAQIPGPPGQAQNGINKGLTLYSNQEGAAAYGLFGSKPLATENIYLRGVVATSKNKDGSMDGFAIFEIDGKPTNAISVGESLGKGLSLFSIGDETATLLYEGQKLNFKLNKNNKDGKDKNAQSVKSSGKK